MTPEVEMQELVKGEGGFFPFFEGGGGGEAGEEGVEGGLFEPPA